MSSLIHRHGSTSMLMVGAVLGMVAVSAACSTPGPLPEPAPEAPRGSSDRVAGIPPEEICWAYVCVVDDAGELAEVRITRATFDGRRFVEVDGEELPFEEAHPETDPRYAASAEWFVAGRPIRALGARYEPAAPVRVVSRLDLERVGSMDGVSLFAIPGAGSEPELLFLPARPGCEFQPYRRAAEASAAASDGESEMGVDAPPRR